jgi:thiol-disulfide isomerase/thioredoxin
MRRILYHLSFNALIMLNTTFVLAQDHVVIKGKVAGTDESKAYLRKDQETIEATINKEEFTFSIPLATESVYELLLGDNSIELYLEPGDELRIESSQADFYSALQFSGPHANENRFYLMRDLKRSQVYNPVLQRIRKKDEVHFVHSLDSVIQSMHNDLIAFKQINPALSKKFEFIESVNRKFIAINQRGVYAGNYASNHPSDPVIEPNFSHYLDTLQYQDPRFLQSPRFKDFVRNHRYNTLEKLLLEKPELKNEASGNIEAMFTVIEELFQNQAIRDYALYTSLKYELRQHGLDIPAKTVEDFYAKCKNKDYVADIKSNYYTWTTLAAGKPAPDFALRDDNGKSFSVKSFEGKLLYVDVWATWCGPCIAEMPYLDSLVSTFKGSTKVAIVKVSLDVNQKPWLKSLKAQPNVVNLRAAEGANSAFAKSYAIKDIPRYILIDPNGKIINVNAPPPSSAELRRHLDRLIAQVK